MAGMVSPMLAIAEPKARLRLTWTWLRRAERTAEIVSGRSTSSAMTTPTKDCGKPPDDGHERDRQQRKAHPGRGCGGRRGVLLGRRSVALGHHGQEEVAVPHGLGEHEHAVEDERGHRGEGQLRDLDLLRRQRRPAPIGPHLAGRAGRAKFGRRASGPRLRTELVKAITGGDELGSRLTGVA